DVEAIELAGLGIDIVEGRIGALDTHDQAAALLDGVDEVGRLGGGACGQHGDSGNTCGQHAAHISKGFHEYVPARIFERARQDAAPKGSLHHAHKPHASKLWVRL